MRPTLNQLYVWDGNKAFNKLSVKAHPSGYRYALNAEIDGVTKTLLIITKSKHSQKKIEEYFKKAVETIKKNEEALKVFKSRTGDRPVLVNVPSI